jgi:CspA family cold shock protein
VRITAGDDVGCALFLRLSRGGSRFAGHIGRLKPVREPRKIPIVELGLVFAHLRGVASKEATLTSDKRSRDGRAAAIRFVKEAMMATGTVKWFNPTKGYGFIQPQDGGRDVFVHISAVERAGLTSLNEGQTVEYEVVTNRGKQSAENLKTR